MERSLLEKLAELSREQEGPVADDPRFELLIQDQLDEMQRLELEQEAERSEETRQLYQAAKPIDDLAKQRILNRIRSELAKTEPVQSRPQTNPATAVNAKPAKVVSLWRRGSVIAAAASVLAAAAIALMVVRGTGHSPLPSYELDIAGGEQTMRSTPSAPVDVVVIGPGSRLQLVLRPTMPVVGSVQARVWVESGGQVRLIDVPADVSAEGGIRITLPADKLLPEMKGDTGGLVIAVGRPDQMAPTVGEAGSKGALVFRRQVQRRER